MQWAEVAKPMLVPLVKVAKNFVAFNAIAPMNAYTNKQTALLLV